MLAIELFRGVLPEIHLGQILLRDAFIVSLFRRQHAIYTGYPASTGVSYPLSGIVLNNGTHFIG
jgi:hypothetical protein